ncbi:MAG: thioredoxin domain-containing protein, partial [Candidatus Binatia bacterium]
MSIGYSACHWCHVMERESFENEQIAALMNELFVSIKVDREERPDLDEIYMNAVQMMTGRGGWPMTMFLTPAGKPFYGGTYFPPEDRYNVPGFPKILRGVANAYYQQPQDVENSVSQILERLHSMSRSAESAQPFEPDMIIRGAEQLMQAHDSQHGGFGQAPKFPNAGVFELFLRAYHRSKNERFLDVITFTLAKMAQGGIYDHLGGGFHRYSVDEKWLVPHFEKMLYDNAQLVRIYAEVYRITDEPQFKRVVEETVNYILREMLQPEGGFYSTQDADSEGVEGKFFVWSRQEVSRILGEETAEVFSRIYDISEAGNFENENILHPILTPEQASKYFNRSVDDILSLVADAKQKLFAQREKRIRPFRDEKLITAWNGLMLSGLAEAIEITGNSEYRSAAMRSVDFIFSQMFRDGHLLHTYKDGVAKILGYLDDYAFLAVGLLDLFEATFDRALFAKARELADIMLSEFWDENDGALFYTGKSHEQLISRAKPAFDASIPSGNSMAAQLLLRLY